MSEHIAVSEGKIFPDCILMQWISLWKLADNLEESYRMKANMHQLQYSLSCISCPVSTSHISHPLSFCQQSTPFPTHAA